jgi:transcriptional regulator with GAF, ATPase, and Fis domain
VDSSSTTAFFSDKSRQTQIRRVLLHVTEGPDKGTQVRLARGRVTVGRSAVNDLVLSDHSVSGTHLEILLGEKHGVLLRDLGSTNGTRVGGVRVREVWIEPGTTISLGKTVISLLSADEIAVPISGDETFGAMWGAGPLMRSIFATLEKVAKTNMSVAITGETGTGKELVARALHEHSDRGDKPFVVLDCGSVPRDLAEAAIFGYRRGAFTGAVGDRPGAFEEADGGTLFLDEIGELPLELQPKLLRVLDRREVQRIGEHHVRKIDVRVLCATHRDLRQMVGQGKFREDLYFRLTVMTIELPPLRDRGDDVIGLAERFLSEFVRQNGRKLELGEEAKAALRNEQWSGNVRQLKNTIERAAHLCATTTIMPGDLLVGGRSLHAGGVAIPAVAIVPAQKEEAPESAPTRINYGELMEVPFKDAKQKVLDDFERTYLKALLERNHGNLSRAATSAGLTRYYLRELLKRLGLHEKSPAGEEEES